jgi:N-dimethylarginine dimethylaminohydrolase
MFSKINSHNEWDTIKEIIVGSAKGTTATLTWDKKDNITEKKLEEAKKLAKQAAPDWLNQEVEEDLDGLANVLKKLGAIVHRPKNFPLDEIYSTPEWNSTSNNVYNARDLNLVVGNKVIESPSHQRNRYYETTAFYPILYNYFQSGFQWIAGPKPLINYESSLPYFRDENERKLTDEDVKHKKLTGGRLEILHKLAEEEILFEAANTLRIGKDLLYLISSSGNKLGAQWLQSVVGEEYRVHTTEDIYRSSHIDSTVMCLRPGLVLFNSARVKKKNSPKIFNKWDKLHFEDVAPTSEEELKIQKELRDPIGKKLQNLGFTTNLLDMSSPWVGMNLLSFDQETVIVDKRQINLIKLLEKHKFNVIPLRMRHMYTQGGGIHCATLDTVRDSKLEDYFS